MTIKATHVDDWLDSVFVKTHDEDYAKFVLEMHRWPAWKQMRYRQWILQHKLFCTYQGQRYRVTGASRLGDIWLTTDFERGSGNVLRVSLDECNNWGDKP